MEHRIILIFGPQMGRLESDTDELVSFLSKKKESDEKNFRYDYNISQRAFSTLEEQKAFLRGVDSVAGEDEDMAVVTDGKAIEKIMDLFKQAWIEKDEPIDEQLQGMINHLQELTESGWIPFSSPCPSSTESAIKRCIYDALSYLKHAHTLCRKM